MYDGCELFVTIQSKDLGVTARLLNADIAVHTGPCEFGLELSRRCERTSCIVILYIGAAQCHKYYRDSNGEGFWSCYIV